MKNNQLKLYGLCTKMDVLMLCNISEEYYLQAIKNSYNTYPKYIKGKKRLIEEPNNDLRLIQKKLLNFLQELDCPAYCQSNWKGKSNIKNAEKHTKRLDTVTLDIAHFYLNTKIKYVEQFMSEKLNITGEALETIISLTTYDGHVPTGGVTSPILAFFAHQPIFNKIYRKMRNNGITMTLYVDDITLSSEKHMSNWVIPYCKQAVKIHGLWLKRKKIKRFGYKFSWITGVRINQAGEMLVPFDKDYEIIKLLKEKPIKVMSLTELRKLIAKIGYIRQISPNRFTVTKLKLIKRLKEVA